MNLSQRCVNPVIGIVCLGRAGSPEGWATEIRLALSERCLDLDCDVLCRGLRSIGLSASAASMSSGVKGLRMRNSLMFSDPSEFR